MGFGNTDIIPQCSSSVLTSGSIPSHRNIHVLIVLLALNCSGQPFWDPQLLSMILRKHKQTLSPKPIESTPLSPDSVPHYLSGVLRHIFLYLLCNSLLTNFQTGKTPFGKPPLFLCKTQVPMVLGATCPETGNLSLSQNRDP